MSSESQSSTGMGGLRAPAPAKGAALARLRSFAEVHPRLLTWAVLAVGMVAILLWAAQDQPLLLQQRLVIVAATVGLAGLCAWIIHWE